MHAIAMRSSDSPCVAGLVRNFLKCLTKTWLVTRPLWRNMNAWISFNDNSWGSDILIIGARARIKTIRNFRCFGFAAREDARKQQQRELSNCGRCAATAQSSALSSVVRSPTRQRCACIHDFSTTWGIENVLNDLLGLGKRCFGKICCIRNLNYDYSTHLFISNRSRSIYTSKPNE